MIHSDGTLGTSACADSDRSSMLELEVGPDFEQMICHSEQQQALPRRLDDLRALWCPACVSGCESPDAAYLCGPSFLAGFACASAQCLRAQIRAEADKQQARRLLVARLIWYPKAKTRDNRSSMLQCGAEGGRFSGSCRMGGRASQGSKSEAELVRVHSLCLFETQSRQCQISLSSYRSDDVAARHSAQRCACCLVSAILARPAALLLGASCSLIRAQPRQEAIPMLLLARAVVLLVFKAPRC